MALDMLKVRRASLYIISKQGQGQQQVHVHLKAEQAEQQHGHFPTAAAAAPSPAGAALGGIAQTLDPRLSQLNESRVSSVTLVTCGQKSSPPQQCMVQKQFGGNKGRNYSQIPKEIPAFVADPKPNQDISLPRKCLQMPAATGLLVLLLTDGCCIQLEQIQDLSCCTYAPKPPLPKQRMGRISLGGDGHYQSGHQPDSEVFADASCNCFCCWRCSLTAAASSLQEFSVSSAALGSGSVVKSGAMPNLSMSTPLGVRYFPTVMIKPELSLSSYTD
jgi:hypothetical protein